MIINSSKNFILEKLRLFSYPNSLFQLVQGDIKSPLLPPSAARNGGKARAPRAPAKGCALYYLSPRQGAPAFWRLLNDPATCKLVLVMAPLCCYTELHIL